VMIRCCFLTLLCRLLHLGVFFFPVGLSILVPVTVLDHNFISPGQLLGI
jgi:hypothetical protein